MDARVEKIIERLADLEHRRWSHWMEYLFTKATQMPSGEAVINPPEVTHWKNLIKTPYAELTPRSQESDRVEVRKTMELLGAPDVLHVHSTIALDWKDRLRILIGRKLHVHTKTPIFACIPGAQSEAIVWIEKRRAGGPMGMAEAPRG